MGEKKRRLSTRPPGQARFDGRPITRAFEALEAGDRKGAARAFEALQAALPHDPDALHAVGVLGLRLGDPQRALELLLRAIELNARDPAYRCHLAIAYRRLGKPDLAIAELETALVLDPALAEAHSNLGNLLLERGANEAAEVSFARALALRRDYPEALNGQGEARLALGLCEEACTNFEQALAVDPAFHETRYNLSRARSSLAANLERASETAILSPAVVENSEIALENIVAALQLSRDNPAYWTQFEKCVGNFDLRHPVDPRVRDLLFRALGHPAVDPARLVRPIASLVATRPDAVEFQRRVSGSGTRDELAWPALKPVVRDLLGDALLHRLLEDVVVPNIFVERLLAFSRRGLLRECFDEPAALPSLPLPAIAAMAHQCFNTEYVPEESDMENSGAAALRNAIATVRASGNPVPLHWYAVYACYRPLHTLDAADAIAADLAPTALSSLAIRQIREPQEERRARGTIAALTEVADSVSAAVQSQYEANPYPRWLRLGRDIAPASVAGFLRGLFPEADLGGISDAPARILVAGCGTGRHPIDTARRFPDSSVLAVDLSLTSLAYALRKTAELGIGNIEYRQGDILALGSLAERFDVIDCTGVLHHLKDPVAGWRILCSRLRPGGVMRVGLYSEIARRHVVRAREFVAAEGFAPTPEGIRACRAAILARPGDALLARVAKGEDFYSLSGCRDLIFHVQEQRFTLPQIAGLLADLDLEFIGFEWPDAGTAARYRARFPEDRALSDLDNWHRFETSRPDTFALMYQFWIRKRA
jgi:tetratricopeptide (TPR) repeat protein/SAM-dependent methyltransferase